MRLSLRLYRFLLKFYPASFRENYSGPLQRQFLDDYAEARGASGVLRLWSQTGGDWLRSLPAQLAREVGQDARHALRMWKSRPLHTAFAVAVLAIAIGANTGVFSVLNALLLRSLPFERPDRLAAMRMFVPPGAAFNPVEFHAWRQTSAYALDAFSYTSSEINIEDVSQSGRAS